MGVDVPLSESLDLDQPAPRAAGRNLVVPLWERSRGRGVGRTRARVVDVDIDELSAERAAEGGREISDHQLERRGRAIRAFDEAELLDIEGAGMEVAGGGIRIVPRAIVIAAPGGDIEGQRAGGEGENNASLDLGRPAGRGYGHGAVRRPGS